jgi:hypothetical protein
MQQEEDQRSRLGEPGQKAMRNFPGRMTVHGIIGAVD